MILFDFIYEKFPTPLTSTEYLDDRFLLLFCIAFGINLQIVKFKQPTNVTCHDFPSKIHLLVSNQNNDRFLQDVKLYNYLQMIQMHP